jgi:hypothetical protein
MSKAEDAKADRELMARIVKKHEAAKKKLTPKLEDFSQAAPRGSSGQPLRITRLSLRRP